MFEALAYFAGYKKADIYPRTAAIPYLLMRVAIFRHLLLYGVVQGSWCSNLWSVPFYTDLGGDSVYDARALARSSQNVPEEEIDHGLAEAEDTLE